MDHVIGQHFELLLLPLSLLRFSIMSTPPANDGLTGAKNTLIDSMHDFFEPSSLTTIEPIPDAICSLFP